MFRYGLKLWSASINYTKEASHLFSKGIYDYIELYIVPGSYKKYIKTWLKLAIPYIIHAPHSAHGMNIARSDCLTNNLKLFAEAQLFANSLKANKIILHPGFNGSVKEASRQITILYDKRIVIENKPFYSLINNWRCCGSTFKDIKFLLEHNNVGFCLDIGHAICSANQQKIEAISYIKKFINLKPVLYHLSDGDYKGLFDNHFHFDKGTFPLRVIINLLPKNIKISIETPKIYKNQLKDFTRDIKFLKNLEQKKNLNVLLILFKWKHIYATYRWLQDAELRRLFMVRGEISWEKHKQYFKRKLLSKTEIIFAILYQGKHVGNCGLKNLNLKKSMGELWIYIGLKSERGKGIGEKATKLLLDYGFEKLKLKKIYLHVPAANIAAINLYKNLGFKQDSFKDTKREWLNRGHNIIQMERSR